MRRRLEVRGVVQGVGFRPFVHGLARRHGVGGFVLNDGRGVVIEAEGPGDALDAFAAALPAEAPPLARVEAVDVRPLPPIGDTEFVIAASEASGATALVPADVATCEDCLRELFDPADRRFRYPFVNCTQCGPRFTIVRRVPYDRPNTTMERFAMCADCRREYEDPGDRRFHAEPIACPACGPRLWLEPAAGRGAEPLDGAGGPGAAAPRGPANPLDLAVRLLHGGAVVAVKGLGGWHLACDAADEEAVARLRERKHREEKPFALMMPEPERLCEVSDDERALLESRERPIVLMRRRAGAGVGEPVAPGTPWLGVMLPYTPLHHLLAADFGGPLVMTSGNRSDEPIAVEDGEARERLAGIADAFLGHDRPIHRRCEDSVVRAAVARRRGADQVRRGSDPLARAASDCSPAVPGFPVRRSRGYAPAPLPLPLAAPRPLVAAGAELKSTFCVGRGRDAFLSPHLGDLDSEPAYRAFRDDLSLYLDMLGVEPDLIACDMHPEYLATKWAHEQEAELVEVQHHHAHAAACLAEHGETGPALALVFDGTGYGPDGTLWGGELLRCDLASFERVAHLEPVPLPGGERAIREPWRCAAAYLERAGRPVPFERWGLVRQSLKVNAPLSSGMGRLFDAAAALLGVRERVTYEGQAAIELEQLAGEAAVEPYHCRIDGGRILGTDLIRAAHDDLEAGRERAEIAAAFHEGVAAVAAAACAGAAEPRTVVLSGGTSQNLRLLGSLERRLREHGFRVLTHRVVPPNDGGISYGQAAVAAARLDHAAAAARRTHGRRIL